MSIPNQYFAFLASPKKKGAGKNVHNAHGDVSDDVITIEIWRVKMRKRNFSVLIYSKKERR